MIEPDDHGTPKERGPLIELVGIYHADGGVWGEVYYVLNKLLGRTHCALCELSHAWIVPRRSFREAVSRLGLPMRLVHLNEREADLASFTEGVTPCVVGRDREGWLMVVDTKMLSSLAGDVERFEAHLCEFLSGFHMEHPKSEQKSLGL